MGRRAPAGREESLSLFRVCRSRYPICPKCKQVLRRIHAQAGSAMVMCQNDVKLAISGGGYRNEPCHQHVYVLGSSEGVCIVTAITPQQFDTLSRTTTPAADFLEDAGVIPARGF